MIKLRLVLTSTALATAKIVSLSGINPTRAWTRGDRVHPKAKNVEKENGCLIEVVANALPRAIEDLQQLLAGQRVNLKGLPDEIDRELSCVVYIEDGAPDLYLSADFVRFAADIGASIDFDLYEMRNEDPPGKS
jgi:hypothetical protein